MKQAMRIIIYLGMGLLTIWAALLALGAIYLTAALFGGSHLFPLPGICLTETIGSTTNIAGFDFEFEEVDCDLIAKDSAVTVYVSRHLERQRYALAKYAGNSPTIVANGPNKVRITLGKIGSLYFLHNGWDNLQVDYDFESFQLPQRDRPLVTQPLR